jgi:hypothetical protein
VLAAAEAQLVRMLAALQAQLEGRHEHALA